MSKVEAKFQDKFNEISARTYSGQARWFLNGFWEELEPEAENLWKFVALAAEIDKEKKEQGTQLDEFQAHVFLEKLGETLTVQAMRTKLREIDLDFNKKMSMVEYLIFKYSKTVDAVVNAKQGGENKEEMNKAQALVDAAQAALVEVNAKLEIQKDMLAQQKAAEDAAKAQKDAAEAAENAALQAEEEQRKTLQELKDQEESLANKIAELTIKSQEGSTVAKGRAVQELESLKSEDPLPLRRAKINQEAAVRKAEKARKFATEQADKAREAAALAEEATKKQEEATRQVEAAVADAEAKLNEAFAYLEEVKKQPGQSFGDLWWMERELTEKRKYMPQRFQKQ